jgi:phage FluMu protein Com
MTTEPRGRIVVERRDYLDYRVKCPRCAGPLGPRYAVRELMDIPPDPPYAAIVRCAKCGEVVFVEFNLEATTSGD